MKLGGLTPKELAVFWLGYKLTLDENGIIERTRMNRFRYRACIKLAGGNDKLDIMCQEITKKVDDLMKKYG